MPDRPIEFSYLFCPGCGEPNPDPGAAPFRCQKCNFCNFFGPVAAVGGLVTDGEGRLLMVRRARDPGKGKWGLPGGFVDRGETIEQALKREILEETGLELVEFRYLVSHPNSYLYQGFVAPVIDSFYVCRTDPSQTVELDLSELEHFEWVRPSHRHLDEMAFESNRFAIQHWLLGESDGG